jgi:hypothetical protein
VQAVEFSSGTEQRRFPGRNPADAAGAPNTAAQFVDESDLRKAAFRTGERFELPALVLPQPLVVNLTSVKF